jgi:hypothetical protein
VAEDILKRGQGATKPDSTIRSEKLAASALACCGALPSATENILRQILPHGQEEGHRKHGK